MSEAFSFLMISLFQNNKDIDKFMSIYLKNLCSISDVSIEEAYGENGDHIKKMLNLNKYKNPKKTVYHYASELFNLLKLEYKNDDEVKDAIEIMYQSIFETIVNKYQIIPNKYDETLKNLPMMMGIEERNVYMKYKLIYGV